MRPLSVRVLFFVSVLPAVSACSGAGSSLRAGDPVVAPSAAPRPSATPGSQVAPSETVSFSVEVPSAQSLDDEPQLLSAAAGTQSAVISVAGPHGANVSSTIPCRVSGGRSLCTGSLSVPLGPDTFNVGLNSGPSGGGTILASGAISEEVSSRTKSVPLTFDPTVASAAVVADPTLTAPIALNPQPAYNACITLNGSVGCGYTQVVLDLVVKSSDGSTIVGPGIYEDAAGDPITLTLVDSDSKATAFAGPASFKEPGAGAPKAVLVLTGRPIPPLVAPNISVSITAGSVATLQSLNVPVAPNDQDQPTTSWSGDGYNVKSLQGSDVTLLSGSDNSTSIAIGTDQVTPADPSYGFTGDGFLTESPLFNGSSFFFEEAGSTSPPNRFDVVPSSGCPGSGESDCPGTRVPFSLFATVAGGDGDLWFAEAGALTIGKWNLASPSVAPTTFSLPAHASASIQSLVAGSGTTLYALVYSGGKVYVEQIAESGAVNEKGSFTLSGGVNIAGYSPIDGNLYVVGAGDSTIYLVDPSNGSASVVLPGAQNGQLNADPNRRSMVTLSDGSLAYVGAGQVGCGGASIVHIVPGFSDPVWIIPSLPSPVSGLNTDCTFAYGLWSIDAAGSVASSDGGNVHLIVW